MSHHPLWRFAMVQPCKRRSDGVRGARWRDKASCTATSIVILHPPICLAGLCVPHDQSVVRATLRGCILHFDFGTSELTDGALFVSAPRVGTIITSPIVAALLAANSSGVRKGVGMALSCCMLWVDLMLSCHPVMVFPATSWLVPAAKTTHRQTALAEQTR